MTWRERTQTLEEEEKYHRGKYLGGSKLEDIFDILRTGEYAAGGHILRMRQLKEYVDTERQAGRQPGVIEVYKRVFGAPTEGAVHGIAHRVSPSAALEIEGFWAGLAADIFLDPTTYLSGGTLGVAKIAAKVAPKAAAKLGFKAGGKIALTKSGTAALKRLVEGGIPLKEAEEVLVGWASKSPEDAAKWIHEGGLRWFGQTVISGKQFAEAKMQIAADLAYITPKSVRTKATAVSDVLGEAFVPGYWMKKLPGKHGEYFTDYLDWVLRKRGAAGQAFHKLKEMARPFKKRGEEITRAIEKGVSTGDAALDEFIEKVVKPATEKMRLEEVARGIDVGEVAGYVHHTLTKKGKEFVEQMGGMPEVWKYYSQKVRAPYAKERTLEGTIEEINKGFEFDFFEPDFWIATAERTRTHVTDIYTADWFKYVKSEYGKPIESLATSAVDEGLDFVKSSHPQLQEALLPSRISRHLEEMVEDPATGLLQEIAAKHDWGMTWWKRGVTVGFGVFVHPAFFVRNVYSGVYQNWVKGAIHSPIPYYKGIKARLGLGTFDTLERGKITGKEMQDVLREQDILGQPGMMDVTLEDIWHRNLWQKARDLPTWLMAETENLVRIPEFVKLAETRSLKQARDETFETHFAYLPEFHTKFEKDVMKRAYPFYTWLSRDIPFQLKRIAEQPRKLGSVGKLQQKLIEHYGMEEEYERRTEWQQNMFLIPNVLKGGKGWIGLGLPFLDLTTDIGDMYFALSPLKIIPELGYIEQDWGSRDYKTTKQMRAVRRLAEGRYGTTARRLARTDEDVDKLMYLAAMPTYDVAPEEILTEFEATRWREEHRPTKEQEYAAWIAAGTPEGYRIKTLVAPPGGMVGEAEAKPKPSWWEVWKKHEPPKPLPFELLALSEEEYQASQGFKPTPEQIEYILTGAASERFPHSPTQAILQDALRRAYELPGTREARYKELVDEWKAFEAGKARLEHPTTEQEMESWRRAGLAPGQKYTQKIYRDELGKLLGVGTYTPEELEEMGGFTPSETQAEWAFRSTRKMKPVTQFKAWAEEHKTQQEQERQMQEELAGIAIGAPIKLQKHDPFIPLGLTMTTRRARRRELEEMLGEGVDR